MVMSYNAGIIIWLLYTSYTNSSKLIIQLSNSNSPLKILLPEKDVGEGGGTI